MPDVVCDIDGQPVTPEQANRIVTRGQSSTTTRPPPQSE
jgi:hypothetical protein